MFKLLKFDPIEALVLFLVTEANKRFKNEAIASFVLRCRTETPFWPLLVSRVGKVVTGASVTVLGYTHYSGAYPHLTELITWWAGILGTVGFGVIWYSRQITTDSKTTP